jgi:hypothetical protein
MQDLEQVESDLLRSAAVLCQDMSSFHSVFHLIFTMIFQSIGFSIEPQGRKPRVTLQDLLRQDEASAMTHASQHAFST